MIFGARELQRRRIALVARCSAQRDSIVAAAGPLAVKAAAADRVLTTVRVHPVLATMALGALAGMVPRILPPWVARVWLLYSLVRRFLG